MNALKICGINSAEFAHAASAAGADYLGFIFAAKSPRRVTQEEAERILPHINRTRTKAVGVFVNATETEIRSVAERMKLDVIQLHGSESAELAASLRNDYEVWKAISVSFDPAYPADAFLVDSQTPGSGKRSDSTLARQVLDAGKKLVLAGGLSAANLVNSSLEDAPGHKSMEKLKELITTYQGVPK